MRMRKLMLPSFHGEAIARYADLIEQITRSEIETWKPGQRIRTRTLAQQITMEVIIRTVFGITDPERAAEMRRLLPRLSSVNPLILLLRDRGGRFGPWARFVRERDRVDELLYAEIGRRRHAEPEQDILGLLLAAKDEDGSSLGDAELRDEVITLLLAGHETTATSIGWAFERLLRHPDVLNRLTGEVTADSGDSYLDAVVKETLRVRPVVTEVFRAPSRTTELGNFRFEADSQLAASIMLIQYDPELYPEPFEFRPERFLEGAPDSYTWIPFGGGVRRCIGAAFAQLEMKVVIATILRHAELRASRAKDEAVRFRGITLLPSRGGEAVVAALR
jgi:cytochrome P450